MKQKPFYTLFADNLVLLCNKSNKTEDFLKFYIVLFKANVLWSFILEQYQNGKAEYIFIGNETIAKSFSTPESTCAQYDTYCLFYTKVPYFPNYWVCIPENSINTNIIVLNAFLITS